MNAHHDKGEFDHLKAELRRLKRAGAPWYFESELHRRLHGEHAHRPRLSAFPLNKAYVLTFVALASLAAAGYMMMMHAGFFAPRQSDESSKVAAASPDSIHAGPAIDQKSEPARRTMSEAKPPAPQRSAVSDASGKEPGLIVPARADSSDVKKVPNASQTVRGKDSVMGVVPVAPSLARRDSAKPGKGSVKDTLPSPRDSVSARKDTLKPVRPGTPVK